MYTRKSRVQDDVKHSPFRELYMACLNPDNGLSGLLESEPQRPDGVRRGDATGAWNEGLRASHWKCG
ncbi:MAG TPA: hypothetical protein ENG51_00850 [Deltaproteobacteria bacterium]|nr:hypothetical protein [Deltaproteobacteria bacterium]